jgi:hypothetical protein
MNSLAQINLNNNAITPVIAECNPNRKVVCAMKRKIILVTFVAVMVVMQFMATWPVFAFVLAGGPIEVRITGTLYSPDHTDIKGMDTLRVYIRHKHMAFKVEDARGIDTAANKLEILDALFPPLLTIVGSEDIIALLQKPEMEGKVITMEGDLYIGNGMFQVTRTWEGKK